MEIGQSHIGNVVVLRPVGRIDGVTSPDFQTILLAAAGESAGGVVVDFAEVDYISSAGLRALMAAMRQRGDRRIAVSGLRPVIDEIFRIARFEHVVGIFASADDAAKSWDGAG